MSFRKSVLFLFAFAVVAGLGIAPLKAAAEKSFSKEEIEKIIHDYIVKNPKLIMDSVDEYQKTYMEKQSAEGLEKNKDALADAGSPEAGNPKGDVTIVEFFDYNCHFCKSAFPAIKSLLEKDKNVRVIFKEFPILGPTSETAAKWALAAFKQNKYYEFHAALMDSKDPISDDMLARNAKKVGMDVSKAKSDVESSDVAMQIAKNHTLANDLGLSGTPAFVIGNDISRGAIPLTVMEQKIAAARAAAGQKK